MPGVEAGLELAGVPGDQAALDGKVPPTATERAVRALTEATLARAAGDLAAARRFLDEARQLAGPIGSPLAARVAAAQAALSAP